MREFMAQVMKYLKKAPFFGPAFDCSLKEYWQTSIEISSGLFWSMLPICVGTFVAFMKGPSFGWQALRTSLGGTIAGGELFIYAAAFLAPIFWMIHHDPPGARRFPTTLGHGLFVAFITVFSAVSFEMQKSGQSLNPAVLHNLAVLFFWTALALTYLATLYHNHRLPRLSSEEMRSQEDSFLRHYRERHQ